MTTNVINLPDYTEPEFRIFEEDGSSTKPSPSRSSVSSPRGAGKALAAYSGPITRCRPGKARGEDLA